MVFFSHSLSSPDLIFEFVKVSDNLYHYYRIYNNLIENSAYAFIYHPFHGAIVIKEYDALIRNFETEIQKIMPYDEESTEESYSMVESESGSESETLYTTETDTSKDGSSEDVSPEALSASIIPLRRYFRDSEYKSAMNQILRTLHISEYRQIDFNAQARENVDILFGESPMVFHFYNSLYIANISTRFSVDDGVHFASSAAFLVKVNDDVYQLNYEYHADIDNITVSLSPLSIAI
jgi:hypothetical protein